MKILLVEDRPDILEMLAERLEEERFLPVPATSTRVALDRFRQDPEIRLVLSDLRLNDGNGLDLIQELKRLRPETRILIVTGNSDIDEAKARARGAHGLLFKPVPFEKILAALQSILAV